MRTADVAPRALALGPMVLALAAAAGGEVFTVVALPDTQHYTAEIYGGTKEMFDAQTAWIAANQASRNIKYVTHLGDFVQRQHDLLQWGNAKGAMSILEGASIPFGTCLGNHDTHYGPGDAKDHAATNYLANFGPGAPYAATGQTFADQPWYTGVSPSGRSNYQVVAAGGIEFLFLNVSIDWPDEEYAWAQSVLSANRDKPAVVSTHRNLYDFKLVAGYYGDALTGRPKDPHAGLANESYYVMPDGTVRTNWPEDVAADFVKANRNVFMVLSGHCHGQFQRTVTSDFGLPVLEVLADYQSGPAGGAGWLRTVEVDTDTGEITLGTYSPVLGRDRLPADDFGETLGMISTYMETLIPMVPGMEGTDPTTPEGKAAIALLIAQAQQNADGQTNPEIAALLAGMGLLDGMDPATRQAHELYPVWLAWDEMRTYVSDHHPLGAAAWDPTGDWDVLWDMIFAPGQRDPSFTTSVDFAAYIPEPASLMLLAGAGPLALIRRRRNGGESSPAGMGRER